MLIILQILYFLNPSVFCHEKPLISVAISDWHDSFKDFTCLDGSHSIPFKYVNDDYCDCIDGSDEPGTSACPEGTFYCQNEGHVPQKIPSSRVNDGYCDCCDGSDENFSKKCSNKCEALELEAKHLREKTDKLFNAGNKIRVQLASKGKRIKMEREQNLFQLESKMREHREILKEKEHQKNITLFLKREALKLKGGIKTLKQQKEEEEIRVANNIFSIVDSNHDNKLQIQEMEERPIFDEDKDGIVSNEELKFFMESNSDVTRTVFFEVVWPKLKHLYLFDKLDFIPSVHESSEHNIVWETDIEVAEANRNEIPELGSWKTSETFAQYDENTTEILQRAVVAQNEYKSAQDKLDDIEQELVSIKDALSRDYGSENEFAMLEGHCLNYSDHSFFFKLCPFDKVVQADRMDAPETILGTWAGWMGNDYKTMLYNRGEFCWKNLQRTVKVEIRCGLVNEVISVLEPTRCEYIVELISPAACKMPDTSKNIHDEL